MLVIITTLTALPPPAAAQSCSSSLSQLSVCTPFVVPGVGGTAQPPNADCCAALKGVVAGCACSTLNIISRLPTSCGLPPVSCNGESRF
ncbi:hypothetical protein KSP39_PZI013250 [Platanthera zijinensis]|uniref:Bifunctional inhibitor/plant lipid transfer protein/seed storage helical domain-containing protein n=1 Tax=Platanthera zijinensis TaxID=2320716 RepID=A0AAP0BDY7_9ASPA